MANFETALAGMRRGEKWRRSHWSGCNDRLSLTLRHGRFVWEGNAATSGGVSLEGQLAYDWEPYQEPKRSLTFDEAVKLGKPVLVTLPAGVKLLKQCSSVRFVGSWTEDQLAFLDLAERRGWRIEETE